jgi:hypothetical protein
MLKSVLRLHNDDIIDLQRWRYRSKQSQHKLIVLAEFIDYWLDKEPVLKHWKLIIKISDACNDS